MIEKKEADSVRIFNPNLACRLLITSGVHKSFKDGKLRRETMTLTSRHESPRSPARGAKSNKEMGNVPNPLVPSLYLTGGVSQALGRIRENLKCFSVTIMDLWRITS